MMKKILAVLGIVALTSTTAFAGYQCEPTYYQAWDNYNQTYIWVRGRDRCYQTYEPRYYEPAPRYSDGDLLIGGLLGFGLGYALNNHHHHRHHHRYHR